MAKGKTSGADSINNAMAGSRYEALDGVRSITHVSLVALHCAMLLTGKLPSQGELWEKFRNALPFTAFQAGGIQVDIFFVLASFLLVHRLAITPASAIPPVLTHGLKRALRMLPMMIFTIIVGHFVMVDCWGAPYTYMNGGRDVFPDRVMTLVLFYTNYCDQFLVGSFLGSLMWSCAVDLQVGIALVVIVKLVASVTKDRARLLRNLRLVFGLLVLVATAIRAAVFDLETVNLIKLGQYSHFGLLQPISSSTWMEDYFGHEWLTSNSAAQTSNVYLSSMYMPTHTRFGPFAVGGFLACSVLLAEQVYNDKKSNSLPPSNMLLRALSQLFCWTATLAALGQLAVPCLPAPPAGE